MGVTPRLELAGATVRFGRTTALDAVDVAVAPGEVVAVLGPSGSGKSTLLRAVAGLEPLAAGEVRIDGTDQAGTPPHRRNVGLMFQDHALFPHLTVGDNVAFGLRMQGTDRAVARARAAALLEVVGLPDTAHRAVQTLSGGEQQRVALARSLAPEPHLLLLDEPLGALDRPLRERLVGELHALFARLELSVVAVTHDQTEAFALADRLVVMDRGRVLQAGAPATVWAAPASAAVATLLGFTNVAPARVDGGRLVTPWGDLGAAAGPAAAVLVRPEGVTLDPHGTLEGVVATRTFAGARTRLRVDLAQGAALDVDHPGPDGPAPGTPVRLGVRPGAVVALPA